MILKNTCMVVNAAFKTVTYNVESCGYEIGDTVTISVSLSGVEKAAVITLYSCDYDSDYLEFTDAEAGEAIFSTINDDTGDDGTEQISLINLVNLNLVDVELYDGVKVLQLNYNVLKPITERLTVKYTVSVVTADNETKEIDSIIAAEIVPPHTHSFNIDWSYDETHHWHECTGCEEITAKAEHTWNDGEITTPATETEPGEKTYTCTVCDQTKMEEIPAIDHEHTYSEDWSYDETHHWHAATCEHDVVANKGEHIDKDSDGKCDVCGYELETEQPHEHTFSTAWSYDETYHWHKSTCGHDDIVADKAAHTASAWIVDMEATYRDAGRMHKECMTCGYILDTAVIPASDPSQAPWWGITNRPETARKYTLMATAGNGGSITNEGTYTILADLDLTYTITPMRGYAIESVVVDGRDMGAITEYTFHDVKANHTISATFRKSFDNPFIDIFESDRYYDAVAFVYENGLFKGVSASEFAPDTTMTRAMFVTVLGRLANVNADMYNTVSFNDVEEGSWYAPYVQWACDTGIVKGYGDGKFGVNDPVTVEQAAVLLARFAAYTGIQTANQADLGGFTDAAMVSDWAIAPMQFVVGNGIYTGTANALEPQSPAKRSLLAEMLYAYVLHFGE